MSTLKIHHNLIDMEIERIGDIKTAVYTKIPEIIACEIVDMFNFKELLTFPTPCEASDERHFKICTLLSKMQQFIIPLNYSFIFVSSLCYGMTTKYI